MSDLVLHEYAAPGNRGKIRLTAAHLGVPLSHRSYDIVVGETQTPTSRLCRPRQPYDTQRAQVPARQAVGEAAPALMDGHLPARDWFAGGAVSLADIAFYADTHVRGEGRDLGTYCHLGRRLSRVTSLPGHNGIDR